MSAAPALEVRRWCMVVHVTTFVLLILGQILTDRVPVHADGGADRSRARA